MAKNKPEIRHLCYDRHLEYNSEAFIKALENYFPGNMSGQNTDYLVGSVLEARGFTAANTLYADSSCPDEINHNNPAEDITSIFQHRWGEIFPLGGLAGLPFTGKTGWTAFTSHCPKDGNIILLFAPHVGVDSQGIVGSVRRDG